MWFSGAKNISAKNKDRINQKFYFDLSYPFVYREKL